MRAALILSLGGLCAMTAACASMETGPVNLAAAETVTVCRHQTKAYDVKE